MRAALLGKCQAAGSMAGAKLEKGETPQPSGSILGLICTVLGKQQSGVFIGGGITRLTASTVEWELIMPPTPHIHHWRPPPFLGLCTRQGTSQGGPSTLLSRWPDAWRGHRPSLKSCLLKAFQAGRLLGDHVTGGSQT